MKKKNKPIIIVFNIPKNKNILNLIIKKILDKKFSCCINTINNIKSYYYWNNKINKNKEIKIIIKSFLYLKNKIINIIEKNHPYKIPEILIFKIKNLNNKYLNWMKSIIKKK